MHILKEPKFIHDNTYNRWQIFRVSPPTRPNQVWFHCGWQRLFTQINWFSATNNVRDSPFLWRDMHNARVMLCCIDWRIIALKFVPLLVDQNISGWIKPAKQVSNANAFCTVLMNSLTPFLSCLGFCWTELLTVTGLPLLSVLNLSVAGAAYV